jgi:hypothetical protein
VNAQLVHAPAVAALLALVAGLAPGNAQAAGGFSGSFAPSLWQLNEIQGSGNVEPSPDTAATTTVNYPTYACADPLINPNDSSCVLDLDATAGEATLVGSDSTDRGNAGEVWAIQWQLASNYTGAPYQLSFNWDYSSTDTSGDDESYYFTIDSSNNVSKVALSDNNAGDSGQVSLTLATGSKFGVGVSTLSNLGGPGYLTITQFNPSTEVPAPLPLLGAGAAFSWSRQLRRRQQRAAARAMDASQAA